MSNETRRILLVEDEKAIRDDEIAGQRNEALASWELQANMQGEYPHEQRDATQSSG